MWKCITSILIQSPKCYPLATDEVVGHVAMLKESSIPSRMLNLLKGNEFQCPSPDVEDHLFLDTRTWIR
eukprot:scaffold662_cov364-Pavlova_lutheri.AAC.47